LEEVTKRPNCRFYFYNGSQDFKHLAKFIQDYKVNTGSVTITDIGPSCSVFKYKGIIKGATIVQNPWFVAKPYMTASKRHCPKLEN